VTKDDVQVPIAVDIAERHRCSPLARKQAARRVGPRATARQVGRRVRKAAARLAQQQLVQLGAIMITVVGNDEVESSVAVHVTERCRVSFPAFTRQDRGRHCNGLGPLVQQQLVGPVGVAYDDVESFVAIQVAEHHRRGDRRPARQVGRFAHLTRYLCKAATSCAQQ